MQDPLLCPLTRAGALNGMLRNEFTAPARRLSPAAGSLKAQGFGYCFPSTRLHYTINSQKSNNLNEYSKLKKRPSRGSAAVCPRAIFTCLPPNQAQLPCQAHVSAFFDKLLPLRARDPLKQRANVWIAFVLSRNRVNGRYHGISAASYVFLGGRYAVYL